MFSRRHPYLFFILIFASLTTLMVLSTSLVVVFSSRDTGLDFSDRVGIIEINGVISDAGNVLYWLKRFREDDAVKAIVIRIDSPGGAVGPAQEIYREITKTISQKKVIASMGTVAASGGYYVAAGTSGIMANPGTITGSIGVIMGFTNLKQLFDKIGMTPSVVKSGPFKDTGSPSREMSADEEKLLQGLVDTVHSQFVQAISEGRKMEPAKVTKIADGRIFSGQQAQTLGLVDRLGNMEDAIQWAGELGGIEGKVAVEYARKPKHSLLRYLLDSSFDALLEWTVSNLEF